MDDIITTVHSFVTYVTLILLLSNTLALNIRYILLLLGTET